jgi:hypothetical protein
MIIFPNLHIHFYHNFSYGCFPHISSIYKKIYLWEVIMQKTYTTNMLFIIIIFLIMFHMFFYNIFI